jgi:hypothetical protein
MKNFNRKETKALDYANMVIEENQLTEDEAKEVIEIASFTKRPNETSPTLISALSAYISGGSINEIKSFFTTEA